MKKILLMGGTGAMGMYLTPLLLDKNYEVWITSRSQRDSYHQNLKYLIGNAKNTNWLFSEVENEKFDAIFDFMMYSNQEFEKVYQKLLSLTTQYFYFSSYRAYAHEDGILTEDTALKVDVLDKYPEYRVDRYGINKGFQENILRKSELKNWTIIRPAMTYGKNRIQWFAGDNFDVVRAVRGVLTALPRSMWNIENNIAYGRDVALMLERLIGKKRAFAQAFHTTTETMSWGQMADVYNQVFDMKIDLVSDEEYIESIDYQDGRIVDRFRRKKFLNEKILSVTGLSNDDFHDLKSGLTEAFQVSNIKNFQFNGNAAVYQAKFDALTGSLTDLAFIPETMRIQFESIRKNALFREKITMEQFRIRVINDYWSAKQFEEGVKLTRTSRPCDGPIMDNRWINFELDPTDYLKKGKIYTLSLKIDSDVATTFTPFVHHYGIGIQRFTPLQLKVGANQFDIEFVAATDNLTDFSLTATDFTIQTSFFIKEMQLKK